jgi:hypothetical protein
MAQGRLANALAFHLFGPLLFTGLALAIPLLTLEAARRQRFARIHRILFLRNAGNLVGGCLILYHSARLLWLAVSGQLILSVKGSFAEELVRWIAG